LLSLLRNASPSATTENLTIEHILPQAELANGARFESVGSIGNLLLVSEEVNDALGAKSFLEKKAILAASGAIFDIGGVLSEETWTEAEIAQRARLLGEKAYDEVWKLPL
jgi:hypothetical protein